MAKAQLRTYVFNASAGTIELPGKIDLQQLLIITDTTKNVILYNFADSTFVGTTVTFTRANDTNFISTLDNTDGTTTIQLNATTIASITTNSILSSDVLQILYERPEQLVRMPEIGTDAFERTRTSNPTSMLDADFEYGLQPTKWLTYDLLRGYPSVYEVPGTDQSVVTVTTDASTGSGGAGESLITVTVSIPFNSSWAVGSPITVKGYLNTVTGFARAEGSFIINSVPTTTSFTYYAKAKVGVSNGDVLSTTYTQVRQGGFYTGASVGTPTFTYSNGSSPSTITVTFATNHGFVPGDTILTSTTEPLASGPYFVESVTSPTAFTYTARATGTISGTITGTVYSRPDAFYSHRPFDGGVMLGTGGPAHGSMAVRMSKKYIRYQSGKSINYNTGALFAPNYDIRAISATSTSATTYTTTTTGTIASGSTSITITSGTNALNNMLISGAGIPVGAYIISGGGSTTLTINVATTSSITAGTTVTFTPSILITTDDTDHGCQPGAIINVFGVSTSGYSGNWTVGAIVDERNLLVPVISTLGSTTGSIGTPCTMQIINWWGSTVRAGTFDEQNGMFWQWDGQQMSVGRRSSTFQIAGTVSVTPDSNSITGLNSRFTSQLASGDRVVIKGMTHVVSSVVNDTQIYVTPDYRGSVAASGVKMVKTIDRLIPQSQWNTDRCDGSNNTYNPSGFQIVTNKMQMIGLQWTWYGAGFVDWMIRGPDGKFITVHRLRGNNLNTEAYMRSGNQPVRYEVVNEGSRTTLSSAALAGDTTLSLTDVSYFPTPSATYPAYCYIGNELISYTGKTTGATTFLNNNQTITAGTLTGVARAVTMPVFVAGSTRNFTAAAAAGYSAGAGIILVGQTSTPSISHWGSAFLQDGGFDTDRGYIFNYQSTNTQISTKKTTAFAIRLAPSVSNAIVGDLGVRDLINRAQLLLQTIEITAGGTSNTNSALVIEGILNPSNYPSNPATGITWNSLNSSALQTGQPSFSQIAAGTSVTYANAATNSPTLGNGGLSAGTTTLLVNSLTGVQAGDDVFLPSSTAAVYGGTKVVSTATTTSSITTGGVTAGTACTFTASIAGNVLTVTSAPSGGTGIGIGYVITGGTTTISSGGTFVVANLTGNATSATSTWQLNNSQSVTSGTLTATPWVLTDTTHASGTVVLGQVLSGGTLAASTVVTATNAQNSVYTGTGANAGGTYLVSYQSATVSSTAISGTVNQVVISNPLLVGQILGTTAQFSRNTYAIPGETVFSFISSPANKDSLDLTPFKELTNTPIGGRGTFPNGPDVLFINVYLTQGAPVLANLVLRWGEAQA